MVLALVLANGVFSGAEIAVLSIRRTRLAQLVEEGSAAARAVRKLRDRPEQFLATVQVGITVIGATAAAFGGASLARRIAPAIATLPGLAHYAEAIALGLVVAAVSYLSLVLGELVPKSIALRAAERYGLAIARPLLGIAQVARPLVWVLTQSSNLLLRPFGDRTTFTESRLSAEELEQLVDEAGRAGALDAPTAEIASRALAFRDLTAGDVMVPRSRVVALPRDASQEDLKRMLLEEGHSRMPVFDGTLDNLIGYVMAKDLAAMAWERQLIVLDDLLRPVHFVPEAAKAVHVLRDLQRRRTQIAAVVDEHGGIAGLLTLEDLVEELVGDIFGETEEPEALWHTEADGAALVRGEAPIREVNRGLALDLPEGEDYTTVAGLCIALAGAVPERGARLRTDDGTEIEIVEASPRLVRLVRIRPKAPSSEEDEAAGE
ncbi:MULTISPECIES: hemolysin family protein [unclassified Anaeromyxobacter]|uniref:hemolysin family protein n=1 Tax=unclassified Anaeromyxobacter TaxID=2620896 RepID=UPI0027E15B99|nr:MULTISPECIES: hemolysin family protein [unclassified Anaeromyxobacter]